MKWIKRNNVKINDDALIIEKLAKVRGIKNVKEWMNPHSNNLNSPYRLLNIDEAVNTIIKAVHKGEVIRIVADIDTDGVCSTAIMYNYLKVLTNNIQYIHSQRSKGHGVETVLDQIGDDVQLVIIVDSSSNSTDECKELQERGIKVVIIDHHKISKPNPYAILVNCQMGDYPNKYLSGSAMCYKVCQVLDEYLGIEMADNFLDLTAIGLVGDLMDIKVMENRFLIYNGLNHIVNLGVKEILKQSKMDYANGIKSTDISFKIAPIVGACSRLDKIELALECLTTEDKIRIYELTEQMIEINEERKRGLKIFVEEAKKSIESENLNTNNVIIYVKDDIGSGYRGLVAQGIVEEYSKPTFILYHNKEKGVYMGSGRSVGVIPLQSLCEDSGLFNFAQGHEGAFGVEFPEENLQKIISYFNSTLDSTDLQKVIEYDLELDASDIEELDIKEVEKFSKIVGQGFPEPKFLIRGLVVEEAYTKKLGNHVRAVMGGNNDTIKINCENSFALMRFRSHESYGIEIEQHFNDESNFVTELEVVGSLNLNRFYNGGLQRWVITKQVFIEDFKIVE
ncbi:putative single-stranded DNA-specific exonuclease [Brevibacillus phage Sundance]|uniref:RecJ-like ssDNA exonuclease n=1 Tax=Brevibacillus phage Sundance TaxID=1691958 RepID=UPI0006BD3DEF|nr:RecJ-like ssDNA exonuclease [Brevibacillus phage Sundance]ALA47944.1 putative single-stranded DNA-specific exonuclease [Brevibacillus phage Sundance]